jgi:hypothetical protein
MSLLCTPVVGYAQEAVLTGTVTDSTGAVLFMQPSQNKTDLRVQQRIPLGGRVSADVIAEVFNVFNQENWSYTTQESSANFGQPTAASAQFRSAQVGFRLTY